MFVVVAVVVAWGRPLFEMDLAVLVYLPTGSLVDRYRDDPVIEEVQAK